MKPYFFAILSLVILTLSLACRSEVGGGARSGAAGSSGPVTLRLGYFPNVTHTQPIVGLARGTYVERLGPGVTLETVTFNAGPSAIEALFAGQLDATYIGPNPAVNGFAKSDGKALRVIAGATSGGALFVVRGDSGITKPADLAKRKISTPQLGNTQDVALRTYLMANGVPAKENRGDVTVLPTANPDIINLFRKGEVDGAWVPEPWGTRLVKEAGGRVFLDERTLWPNGEFVTTLLVVRTEFLQRHPEVVENLLRAHVDTTQWIAANPDEAKRLVNDGIKNVTGAGLPPEVLEAAWGNQKVTFDPVSSSLRKSTDDAFKLGFLGSKAPDLSRLMALESLNKILREQGLPPVSD